MPLRSAASRRRHCDAWREPQRTSATVRVWRSNRILQCTLTYSHMSRTALLVEICMRKRRLRLWPQRERQFITILRKNKQRSTPLVVNQFDINWSVRRLLYTKRECLHASCRGQSDDLPLDMFSARMLAGPTARRKVAFRSLCVCDYVWQNTHIRYRQLQLLLRACSVSVNTNFLHAHAVVAATTRIVRCVFEFARFTFL